MGEGKSLAQLYFEEYARHCPTTGGKRYLPEWPELSSHVRTCWIRRAGVRLSKRARRVTLRSMLPSFTMASFPRGSFRARLSACAGSRAHASSSGKNCPGQEEPCSER